jgi:hypothetical protein
MATPSKISVLVEREGDWWIAQCIEYDLATQAKTVDDLLYEIRRVIVSHIASCEALGIEPFDLPPAPREVQAKYERARNEIVARGDLGPRLVTNHVPPIAEVRIAA